MLNWLGDVIRDLHRFLRHTRATLTQHRETGPERTVLIWCLVAAVLLPCLALLGVAHVSYDFTIPGLEKWEQAHEDTDLTKPVRREPRTFRPNTHRPRRREGRASGSIEPRNFSARFDLVRLDDTRAWWESEHDVGDTEDDHLLHRAMEEPMRRLIELVWQEGGLLKVQDAYRSEGIHAMRSLHKEGRAVDLTCSNMTLEALAKLCWASGFDWVYYESPKKGGAHIHCSVRADREY